MRGDAQVRFGKERKALRSGRLPLTSHKGTFRLPDVEPGVSALTVDERALDDLLDGIDVEAKSPTRRTPIH